MKYPYTIKRVKRDSRLLWVAESVLKGCVGQGSTIGEAVIELSINEEKWLKAAASVDLPIPEITVEDWDKAVSDLDDYPSLGITPKDLRSLLQVCFDCDTPFMKEPQKVGKELDGNDILTNFTLEGAKAYDKLTTCIYVLSAMGLYSSEVAEHYIKMLDEIATENGAYAANSTKYY